MAKKKVLVSTCDNCGKTVTTDYDPKPTRGEFVLPDKWLHLSADNKTKNILSRDLCDTCAKPILEFIRANGA
jgi:hypothetical protein